MCTGAVHVWPCGLDHHTGVAALSLSQAPLPDSEPFGHAPVDASRIAAGDSWPWRRKWVGWNARRSAKAVTGKRYGRLRERVLSPPGETPSTSRGAASNSRLVTGRRPVTSARSSSTSFLFCSRLRTRRSSKLRRRAHSHPRDRCRTTDLRTRTRRPKPPG